MLKINCDMCGEKLNQPGALLFSPPRRDKDTVKKTHLCVGCWHIVATCIENKKEIKKLELEVKRLEESNK